MSEGKNKSAEELRHRAEKRLHDKKQKLSVPKTMVGLQRIVQELEVHQIELEMQNEELQQTRSKLESFLVQYTDLYDFAPVGYFTLDRGGMILQANLTGARMLGLDRSCLIKQHFLQFIAVDFQCAFAAIIEQIFDNDSQETSVIGLQKEGSGTIFVQLEAQISNEGQECRIALIDITAQKKAEELFLENERKFRILFENMVQGVVLCEQDGGVVAANPAAEHILGHSLDQMQASSTIDFFPKAIHEDGTIFAVETQPHMVVFRMNKPIYNVVMGILLPQNTRYIWLRITALPLPKSGGGRPTQVLITFEDITFQKRLLVYNTLTMREKEVFKLLARGYGRQVIADYLDIRPKTVDKHRENLMEKLSLHKIEELLVFSKLIGIGKA